ncbi:MAG: tetratricopeptide repeat protein [Candidatus Obscuribacterales bacterium]|nr:tetratricopeptide repeat protein [Candidatus Obscuribacterales bacterium]
MPPLRHCKEISATLVATLYAATSSISFSNQAFAAENKKSIAMAGVAHTTSAKKAPTATKSPNLQTIYPRTHFEKAYYFKQKHDLNNALIEFIKSTQENPLLVRGFYEEALIFRERGYLKLAASSLEQALAVKPDYQDARILLATISIQQGNVGGAVRELTRSLGLEGNDNKVDTEKDNKSRTPIQKVTKEVREKVKDADAIFDAMPSVILQSIHPEIKHEKTKEEAVTKENTHPEENKTAVGESSTDSASSETTNKHFDLASIKDSITDSIKDSFEAAMHAPLSLSTYWSHLPFGNSQPIEKTQEQLNEKIAEQTIETKAGKHKKEKKQKRKHKKEDSNKTGMIQPSEQSEQTKSETFDQSRSDITDTTAMLPDFVKKAIADHKKAEETAVATAQAAAEPKQSTEQDEQANAVAAPESNKTLFSSANFSQSTHAIIKGLKTTDNGKDQSQLNISEATKPNPVHLDTDEWAIKLQDLVEHGTNSLKDGEAFMFAEDTGEASLFLADGSVIRRIVQLPRDQTEIVRQRRPDMLIPDDLLYKLSLLGKLIPHPEGANTPVAPSVQSQIPSIPQGPPSHGRDFKVDNVMGESQNFWGWLKNAFKF